RDLHVTGVQTCALPIFPRTAEPLTVRPLRPPFRPDGTDVTHMHGKYADFENLRERAVELRRAGRSLRQIRDELKVYNNDILNRLVKGEPPPAWTRRPRAKDDLRARARELRLQGWTYDRIEIELGCSKSSVSLWVRDLPKPERKR